MLQDLCGFHFSWVRSLKPGLLLRRLHGLLPGSDAVIPVPFLRAALLPLRLTTEPTRFLLLGLLSSIVRAPFVAEEVQKMPNFDTSYIRKNVFILPSLFILFSLVEVSKLSCCIFRGLIMASLISTTENILGAYLFHYNISQFYNFHHFFYNFDFFTDIFLFFVC